MFKCKKCDSTKYVLREKGTATGLYCAKCGFWHKWVAKSDLVRYKVGMHQSNDYEQKMLNWAKKVIWKSKKVKNEIIDCIIETLQGEGGEVKWDSLIVKSKGGLLNINLGFWNDCYTTHFKKDFTITLSKEQVKNQVIKRLFKGE